MYVYGTCNVIIFFQLPPIRIFLLGPRGSGKTTLGRLLAEKLGIFHISFREYLQNQILCKMKKPPLLDEDDWENNDEQVEGQFISNILYICMCKYIHVRRVLVHTYMYKYK